jgi:hypothetical protein
LKKIFVLICFFATNSSFAQKSDSANLFRITLLPVVYYSPETRLGFGGLLGANFETVRKPDSVTKTSYIETYILYTVNHQYDGGGQIRLYKPKNKLIFQGKFNFSHFPEYYFGLQTENPSSHKDTISYYRVSGDTRFYWKVKKNYYTGLAARFNQIKNVEAGIGQFEIDKPVGYSGYWIVGIAPAFTYESRDNVVYPRKGAYIEAVYFVYPSWEGSSYGFNQLRIDARKYFPLKSKSNLNVLAFQFLANLNTGDVPFKDMADIGGSNTMRGYYTGFYRYKNLYALQAEYRIHVWNWIGISLWTGAALTTEKWYAITDHSIKPNAGIGLRLMVNKKDHLNVRVDQGWGNQGQKGFYLDIAEAY